MKNHSEMKNESYIEPKNMRKILSILFFAASLTGFAQLRYDEAAPQMKMPQLVRDVSPDYDPNNRETFAIYRSTHLIGTDKDEQIVSGKRAIWCTREATYLAERIYFSYSPQEYQPNPTGFILDCATGIKYRQTGELGYPRDKGKYLVMALPYTYVINIEVYPPLPATCTHVSYGYENPDEPAESRTHMRFENLTIDSLQRNQNLMQEKAPIIIK